MILFDGTYGIFKLDTPNTSYVIGLADGRYPCLLYYGKRLEEMDLGYLMRADEGFCTPETVPGEKVSFFGNFAAEYPSEGIGDYRESCIGVRMYDGTDMAEPVFCSHRIYEGKPALEGLPASWGEPCDTLELYLEDPPSGLQIQLNYTVFRDLDVIARSAKITNAGTLEKTLTRALSACLNLDRQDLEVLLLEGSWAREREIRRIPLLGGAVSAESVRGISSHQMNPFLALVSEGCSQTEGEAYALNLVYSGNFLARAEREQFGSTRAVIGIHPSRFSWSLKPQESFQTPEAILVYSDRGLGEMTRTFHRFYREHLIRSPWKDRERPVLINNWEATYFDFNTKKILEIAEQAAKCGIELFVLDDGWFGHRDKDNSSLGDWYVNEKKLTGGMKELSDRIHGLGMKFGLWFEPEMISRDSDLYRAHPDWALQAAGREPGQSRNQYVLDFSRAEVREHIYGQMRAVLDHARIDYIKWDMNRPLSDVGSSVLPRERQGEILHRYMLGVYELQERLITDFPELLLENCSGGGGRFDPGMLYYSPQIWCSDDTDAIERLTIQEGTALVYPLSCIGAHVSACPNHITGRTTPFDTRAKAAMAGTFGYELDVTKLTEEERGDIPKQIALQKKVQKLTSDGDYYRIASYRENRLFDCWMIVSRDKSEAVVTYVQVLAQPNMRSRRIRLQGLLPDLTYEVRGKRYLGSTLMNAGILMERRPGDFQSELVWVRGV